jgi:hypothetical protein
MKACTECGASFLAGSNSAKYCPGCGPEVEKRKAAERQARRREKLRSGLPPMGKEERAILREIRPFDEVDDDGRPVWVGELLRDILRQESEHDLLVQVFPDGGYSIFRPGSSRAGGDLDRLGWCDEASREHGTEKLIAGPVERSVAREHLRNGGAAALDKFRNATRRGRGRSKA